MDVVVNTSVSVYQELGDKITKSRSGNSFQFYANLGSDIDLMNGPDVMIQTEGNHENGYKL
jgi:hypothetical protein